MKTYEEGIGRHPSVQQKLSFFDNDHLPEHLQRVAEIYEHAALETLTVIKEDNSELTNALDTLVQAKDYAVRAKLLEIG